MSALQSMVMGTLFALLGALASAASYHLFLVPKNKIPVVEIENYELVSDEVAAGGDLLLKFVMSRNAKCLFVTTFRFVTDSGTDKVVDVQVVSPKTLDVGRHQRGTVGIRVPESLPGGDYRFQAITFNTGCIPDGDSFTAVSPTLNFKVK